MVIRTQISLTEDQMRRLRDEARRRKVSIAAVIRDAVDRVTLDEEAERRKRVEVLLSVVGTVKGAWDDAVNHDALLGEDRW
jgi:hypothetical protein